MAAPSHWARGRKGLFPATRFASGDIVVEATTSAGWAKASGFAMREAKETLPNAKSLTVVTVEAVAVCRQAMTGGLAGQPSWDPWASMIMLESQESVEANVVAEVCPGTDFLRFRFLEGHGPFLM